MGARNDPETEMEIQHFFDEDTWTLTYVVHDGRNAVVIDSVRDYDPKNGRTSWTSAWKACCSVLVFLTFMKGAAAGAKKDKERKEAARAARKR